MSQRIRVTRLRPPANDDAKLWALGVAGKYGQILGPGERKNSFRVKIDNRIGEEILFEDEFENVHHLKGRMPHSWNSRHEPGSDVNLECSHCGLQQSPCVNGVRDCTNYFYRKGPNAQWFQSKTVPFCEVENQRD